MRSKRSRRHRASLLDRISSVNPDFAFERACMGDEYMEKKYPSNKALRMMLWGTTQERWSNLRGKWAHFAVCRYASGSPKLYINGVLRP